MWNSLSVLEPHNMDSLGHQHCAKKLSSKIALYFKVLCESKATLPLYHDIVLSDWFCSCYLTFSIYFIYWGKDHLQRVWYHRVDHSCFNVYDSQTIARFKTCTTSASYIDFGKSNAMKFGKSNRTPCSTFSKAIQGLVLHFKM